MPSSEPLTISNVAVPVADGVAPFELGVASELFALDRSEDGLPGYDFALTSASGGPVRTTAGYSVQTQHRHDRMAQADLVVLVAGTWVESPPDPALVASLRAAHDRGCHVMAICRGAFLLAATGLLDHRPATTHWRWADEFAERFPAVDLRPHALYVDDGDLSTSGGTTAGIDLGLHLLRRAHGAAVASAVARRMLAAPHRDGDQAQFAGPPHHPTPTTDAVARAQQWALDHIAEPVTVADLARAVHLSTRTFTRQFTRSTGTTPARWLSGQRLALACELLETTPDTVERIARAVGLASVDSLQQQFRRTLGTTPSRYRETFRRGA